MNKNIAIVSKRTAVKLIFLFKVHKKFANINFQLIYICQIILISFFYKYFDMVIKNLLVLPKFKNWTKWIFY
jgi:hypothetical protein